MEPTRLQGHLAWLDAAVLGRLLLALPPRESLCLAALATEWPLLVTAQLRRLAVEPGAPLGAALVAAVLPGGEGFPRLRELLVDARPDSGDSGLGAGFLTAAAALLERLAGRPVERLTLRGLSLEGAGPAQSAAQLRLLRAALPGSAAQWPCLSQLHLEQVPLGCHSPVAARQCLLSAVSAESCQALVSLTLRACFQSGPEARPLCAALGESPLAARLRRLDLGVNGLSSVGAQGLASVLPNLASLEALILPGNALGAHGTQALAQGLPAVAAHLRELDISENGLGRLGLEALLPAGLTLQVLSLRRSWLAPEDAPALQQLLAPMSGTLTKLDLAQNKLGAAGVRLLLEQLPPCPRLRILDMAENHFATAEFATEPCPRFAACAPHLEDLNLNACRLGSDEAALRALAGGLPPALRVLQLSASDLQTPRLQMLLEALPMLAELRSLSLVAARLDGETAEALAARAPLAGMPKLQVLDISGNAVPCAAATRLAAALRAVPTFRQLRGARLAAAPAPSVGPKQQ